ncbi:MAG: hypothetical protein JNL76_07725 [Alphaproteobacteria bacterium]|nr:hypothetical protein [Alphaproteobacteria bacterium]
MDRLIATSYKENFSGATHPVAPLSALDQMKQEILIKLSSGILRGEEGLRFFFKACQIEPDLYLSPLYIREGTSEEDLSELKQYQSKILAVIQKILEAENKPENPREAYSRLMKGLLESSLCSNSLDSPQPEIA